MEPADPAAVEVLKDLHLLDLNNLEQEILLQQIHLKVMLEEQDIIVALLKTVVVEVELVELEEMLPHLSLQMVLEV